MSDYLYVNEPSYASIYRKAVREARRIEDAQIRAEREREDARIAAAIARNGGKPARCPYPTELRKCLEHCRGCCTLSYIAPTESR